MDRNAKLFYDSALRLNLPITFIPDINFLKIDLGRKHYYFHRSINPLNEGASIYTAKNKYYLNKLLKRSGYPVPKAITFTREQWKQEALETLVQELTFPLVAKPWQDTGRGLDVICNIKNLDYLSQHLEHYFEKRTQVLLEEFHTNLREFRVVILKNRILGVIERISATVTGDGKHSIEALMTISNKTRIPLMDTLTISPLVYDKEYQLCLEEQGLTLQSIPTEGQEIRLCYTANTGRGGNIFSYGKKIHPENTKILREATKCTGLVYVGYDLLCEDIHEAFRPNQWFILEANYNPDSTLHELANHGERINISKKILWQLIRKHPLSYLYHLCMHSRFSFYFRFFLMVGIILGVANKIVWVN